MCNFAQINNVLLSNILVNPCPKKLISENLRKSASKKTHQRKSASKSHYPKSINFTYFCKKFNQDEAQTG